MPTTNGTERPNPGNAVRKLLPPFKPPNIDYWDWTLPGCATLIIIGMLALIGIWFCLK
jgi:hypothetical protein